MRTVYKLALAAVALTLSSTLMSSPAFAAWSLNAQNSQVHFISVKKDAIGEVHQFKEFKSQIADNGQFELAISLASVETAIPIRNDRLKEFLFEAVKFPVAIGKGTLDPQKLKALALLKPEIWTLPISIELHGKTVTKDVQLQVLKLSPNQLLVTTVKALILNAEEFDLVPGLAKLKELAVLPSIATAVPLTASLFFEHVETTVKKSKGK